MPFAPRSHLENCLMAAHKFARHFVRISRAQAALKRDGLTITS